MERPMTEWNNDRLDELNGRVKEGFAEVDKRFDRLYYLIVVTIVALAGSLLASSFWG